MKMNGFQELSFDELYQIEGGGAREVWNWIKDKASRAWEKLKEFDRSLEGHADPVP